MVWRSAWADAINRELREHGFVNFVDHRSFKDRGLPYQPTIHEGIIAIALERKGIVSERCEYNRQIRKDNNALDYWANAVVELSKVAVLLIADIAKALEMLFSEICFQIYVWKVTRRAIANAKDTISESKSRMKTNAANADHCEKVLPEYEAYEKQLTEAINEKLAEVEKAKEQAKQFDPDELLAERMKYRQVLEEKVEDRIYGEYGDLDLAEESISYTVMATVRRR